MQRFYYISAKKAIPTAVLIVFFLVPFVALAKTPNDPQYIDQERLWNIIGAPTAWENTTGSKDVTVAIIDSGIDTWHDDLRGNIWQNQGEIEGNGIDDDKNGYVDDLNGWNFVENNNDVRTSVFEKVQDPKAIRHGTIIGGLIGAVGNNGKSGTGLNWQVRLMAIRAIDSGGAGSVEAVQRAIEYAVRNGAGVITLSFVGDFTAPELKTTLRSAYDRGVVIVAAAGNNRALGKGDLGQFPLFPACYDQGDTENWVIGVTSSDFNDRLSSFANFGSCVDMVAPGQNLYSTERYAPQYGYNKEFGGPWNGTSFSAPIVAGAAALVKAVRPDWGSAEVTNALLSSADDIDAANHSLVGQLGYGRLNVGRAIEIALVNRPVKNEIDGIFYLQDRALVRYDFASKSSEIISRQPLGVIRDFSVAIDSATHRRHFAMLVNREGYYFVRLIAEHQPAAKEFFVDRVLPADKSVAAFNRIRLAFTPDGTAITAVERFDSRRLITTFTAYDAAGKKISEIKIKTKVHGWDLSPGGEGILTAQIKKNRLSVVEVDWSGAVIHTVNIGGGISVVDDFKTGKFFSPTGSQAVILARQGKSLKQYVIDMPSASFRANTVANSPSKEAWVMAVGDTTGDGLWEIIRFPRSGGRVPILTLRDEPIREVVLPSLPALSR